MCMQVLLSFVFYCSILLWLGNPDPVNTSQTKKGTSWVEICQLVDF